MDKRQTQNTISLRYIAHFVVQVIVFTVILAIAFALVAFIGFATRWTGQEFFYPLARFVANYLLLLAIALWLIGVLVLLVIQWRRVARSIVMLADSIEEIAAGTDYLIELPDDLREIQNSLQRVQAQIAHDRRVAADADQRKNDLIVYLAHDLKTPLTSVLGYLALLRDEKEISPELRQKYLNIAANKAQRLEDLINEFFEITRFSLKSLILEPSRLNFSRMLEQVTDEFRPMFSSKELTYTQDIQPNITMTADADKLERVIDNLLRNAISYSYPGTEINITAKADNNTVQTTIRNHGDTIPQHKLDHIFEQFYRVDASRSGEEGGAGLGLAIAKEIVDLHGGSITVYSADEIIEFTISLPLENTQTSLAVSATMSKVIVGNR